MHIYTMGTRAYADAVTNVIDPTHCLFQDRILSRDENGSMTKKRLERLFPSDQTKVVVLDDRADVWDWSPNLIQIKPYEYFAGIGDINAPPVAKDPVNIPAEDQDEDNGPTDDNDNVNTATLGDNVYEKDNSEESAATKEQEQDKNSNNDNVITETFTPKPTEIPNYSHYTPKANDPDNTLEVVQKVKKKKKTCICKISLVNHVLYNRFSKMCMMNFINK
jgi:RNA polymerase II subunit A-like phosphatase